MFVIYLLEGHLESTLPILFTGRVNTGQILLIVSTGGYTEGTLLVLYPLEGLLEGTIFTFCPLEKHPEGILYIFGNFLTFFTFPTVRQQREISNASSPTETFKRALM